MKRLVVSVLITAVSSLLVAQELTTEQLEVKAMIQEIHQSSEGERYQKMNAFKKRLALMSQEQKSAALKELGLALGLKQRRQERIQMRINENNGQGEQLKSRIQERNQLQIEQSQLKLQQQMQNQNRVGKMGTGAFGSKGRR